MKNDRIKGSLLGLAWGDIYGCPIEGWKKHEITTLFGDYEIFPSTLPVSKMKETYPNKMKKLRPLGIHSDDTQQAVTLIQSILTNRQWSTFMWSKMLVEGHKSFAWRGTGANFNKAIQSLSKGVSPQRSGSSSAGMGAAMRIGPIGALYHDKETLLRKVAIESTLITHSDIRAVSLSFAVAYIVSCFVNGISIEEIIQSVPLKTKEAELEVITKYKGWNVDVSSGHLVSNALSEVLTKEYQSIEEFRSVISNYAKPFLNEGFTKAHPNQGFVLLGGLHAIGMSLLFDYSPDFILSSIVREGYDTDTVGAIAGSILGSRYGIHWIPTDLFLDQTILSYANALLEKKPFETTQSFIQREKKWTRTEKDFPALAEKEVF